MSESREYLKEIISVLEPWRHDIELDGFSTFDIGSTVGPFADASHPKPRGQRVIEFLHDDLGTVVDLGCNAGGISFMLEDAGYDVTGIDSSEDNAMAVDPLLQARLCKQIKGSNVKFIDQDVCDHLRNSSSYDAAVVCGLLYHIGEGVASSDRDRTAEEQFIDLVIENTNEQIIFEADETPWLTEYIEDRACVIYEAMLDESVYGVRHIVVADIESNND